MRGERKKMIEQVPVYGKGGDVIQTLSVPVELVRDEVSGEYVYTAESLAAIDEAIEACVQI